MISITLKKKAWRIPDRWGELTPADGPRFVAMSSAMASFEEDLITFDEFRVRLTLAAAGIRKVPEITDTMAENVYRLSELLTYPLEDLQSNWSISRKYERAAVLCALTP